MKNPILSGHWCSYIRGAFLPIQNNLHFLTAYLTVELREGRKLNAIEMGVSVNHKTVRTLITESVLRNRLCVRIHLLVFPGIA